jgi:hypothetical protein
VTTHLVDLAREIADEVLFPAALVVDSSGAIPDGHWRALAGAGLYGIAAPLELGGPGLEFADLVEILEIIAGGCLATASIWVQHHGVLAALSASSNTALRDELLPELIAGRTKGGVAFAGAVPVPPRMRAERVDGGWRLSGHAPFVSGWGVIDVLQVSAGDVDSGDIVAGIINAEPAAGITGVSHQSLFVADATETVSLDVDGLVIPDERIVSRVTRARFTAAQNFGSRLNGTLPIGLVLRCAALLEAGGPDRRGQGIAFRRRRDPREAGRRTRGFGPTARRKSRRRRACGAGSGHPGRQRRRVGIAERIACSAARRVRDVHPRRGESSGAETVSGTAVLGSALVSATMTLSGQIFLVVARRSFSRTGRRPVRPRRDPGAADRRPSGTSCESVAGEGQADRSTPVNAGPKWVRCSPC